MKRLTGRAPDGTAYLYNMGGTNAAIDRLAAEGYIVLGWLVENPKITTTGYECASSAGFVRNITHWMPLPILPSEG